MELENFDLKNEFELGVIHQVNKPAEEFKLSDGRILYIQQNNYNFFHILKELKKEDICKIFDFKMSDLINLQNNFKKDKSIMLLEEISKIWRWRESGELYSFQDANDNEDLFGINLTKNQIIRRIKSKKISAEYMEMISVFFETQEELYNSINK